MAGAKKDMAEAAWLIVLALLSSAMIWSSLSVTEPGETFQASSVEVVVRSKFLDRPFSTELVLVEAILKSMCGARRNGWSTALELDAGVGLADIVVANRNPNSTRSLKALASIPTRLAPLLDPATSARVTSLPELAAMLGLSASAAVRIFATLRGSGVVRPLADGFSLASIENPPFKTIVAIEAKLSDWGRALVQAYRNQQFADESWVVLDHCYHRAALKNAHQFARAGVGLASVAQGRGLFVHVAAQMTGPVSLGKRWTAQAALAKRMLAL
jgi:hypothetical protein